MPPALPLPQQSGLVAHHQPRDRRQPRAAIAAVVLDHGQLPIKECAVDVGLQQPGALLEQNGSDAVQAGHVQWLGVHGSSPDLDGAEVSRIAQARGEREESARII
ncbi:hypothetical protein XBLMG947_3756 [Xanthomonas bromi]|uniref:Uncharacterized protein n=1 Tax=Xanthomonas bromi TaxID=56449 RepID=A0A1C3NRJ1_9XANT|nr:hypothetical protein XBLMG947_3756 [Xanthomonas bromi]